MTIGVRLKEDELAAVHQRFRRYCIHTPTDLIRGYLNGEISRSGRTDKIERLLLRLKKKCVLENILILLTRAGY